MGTLGRKKVRLVGQCLPQPKRELQARRITNRSEIFPFSLPVISPNSLPLEGPQPELFILLPTKLHALVLPLKKLTNERPQCRPEKKVARQLVLPNVATTFPRQQTELKSEVSIGDSNTGISPRAAPDLASIRSKVASLLTFDSFGPALCLQLHKV